MPGRLFVAVEGNEVLYHDDLPSCCRRTEHKATTGSFDCPTCGACWRIASKSTPTELVCGCLVEEDGPVVLCRTADKLARRTNDLIPPFGDDDPDSWDIFHRALGEYRTRVRTP